MKLKSSLLVILLVLVSGGAAAGAIAAYYWQRATAVPTWYASSAADSDLAIGVSSSRELWQNKLATGDADPNTAGRQVEIQLTESEINQLLQEELSQLSTTAPLMEMTQGLKASLAGDRLQAGLVVNPSQLPMQDFPPEAQQTLQQALNSLPLLENQAFYLGITGNPTVENGQLVLGDDTRFQIGNVQLSLAEVARIAGVSPTQLSDRINGAIAQSGVTLDDLSIMDGQIILRGTAQ